MADMPEELYAAVFPNGYEARGGKKWPPGTPVPSPALLLCNILWRYIRSNWRQSSEPLFVFHSADRLASVRNIGKRAVEEQLGQLRAAGLVTPGWCGDKRGFYLQVPARPACQAEVESPNVKMDRSMDRRSPINGSVSMRNGSEIADPLIGGSPIDRSVEHRSYDRGLKEEPDLKPDVKPEEAGPAAAAAALHLAQEILSAAPLVPGALVLARSAHARDRLAQLLTAGEGPDHVREVLALAPAIVAAGREPLDWICPDMFLPKPWQRWGRHAVALRAERAAAERAAQQATHDADAAAEHERALERERVAFAAAAPQRAEEARVLLTASLFQPSEDTEDLRRRGLAREAYERRAASAQDEARLAANRELLALRQRLDRQLTDDEADVVYAAHGLPSRRRPLPTPSTGATP